MEHPLPQTVAVSRRQRWRFASQAALVTFALANLPLVAVCWIYRDSVGTLFRLYPGQFLFLAGPFALASLFTWRAWLDAIGLYQRHLKEESRIWRVFRPRRRFLPFAVVIGAIVAGGSQLEGPALYGRDDADLAIRDFADFLGDVYAAEGSGTNVTPLPTIASAMARPGWIQWIQLGEFVELATVVFVAFHLFVSAGFLAYTRRKVAATSDEAHLARRTTIWVVLALTMFLMWPPLRMCTLQFIELANPAESVVGGAGSVVAVFLAIMATCMFVLLTFATTTTAKWLLATAYAGLSGGFVALFAIRADIVFEALSTWRGVANAAAIVLVVPLALGLLLPYLDSLLEKPAVAGPSAVGPDDQPGNPASGRPRANTPDP